MHQTRRQLLKTAIGGAAGFLAAPVLRLAAQQPGNEKLADDLYIVRIPGEAAVVAHTSREGVLLVDGGSALGSDGVLKAVAALPSSGPTIKSTKSMAPNVTFSRRPLAGGQAARTS